VGFIPVLPLPWFHDIFIAAAAALAVGVRGVEKFGCFVGRLFLRSSPRSQRLAAPRRSPPHGRGGGELFGPPPSSLFPVASSSAGSSATEFGGHHPLLSHLVMKHGGHKDLAELASLARIEREMGARATFVIDSLPRHPSAATHPPSAGARQAAPPPPATPRGRQARPAPRPSCDATQRAAADTTRRRVPPIGAWSSAVPLPGADGGARSTPPAPDEGGRRARWAREVEDAAEDMRRRVSRFRMVYASPVHVRERFGGLAHSAFSADRRWRGGGAAGAVVMDAAAQIS
jgi:hypothetical protein